MEPPTYGEPLGQDLIKANFIMLILGGHICFPFMLFCIFILRDSFSRSWLFLHFCFSWVIHSVGFCILLYSGNATGPEPAFVPCIIQVVLVYIAPVLSSSFLCALVYHLCFTIEAVMNSKTGTSKLRMMTLITGPYFVSLIPAFAVCVTAMNRPELVLRGDDYHCSIWFRPLTIINASIAAIFLISSVVLQFRIGFVLYRNRLVLKQVTVQGFNLLHLFIRLSLFMVITVVGAAMALVAVLDPTNKARIVYQASLPLLAFLTFGTRLNFYGFGKREEKPAEVEQLPAKWRPKATEVIT